MLIASICREAAQALRFNRQRSILTMISLAWGVACFVILYSYGEGFHFALQKAFRSVGQDLVLMYRGQTSAQAGGERAGRRIRLERSDVDAIRDTVPLVAAVSPEMMLHGINVVHGYRNQVMTIRGVAPVYSRIRNQSVAAGRWIENEDQVDKRRVAVLGSEAATKLFGEVPPVGEQITVNGLRFDVVGLLKTKTQIATYETPDNESIFIPYEAASLYADLRYPTFIVWMPANPVFRDETVRQVRQALARQHNFSPTDERAVGLVVFNQYMRLIDTMGLALRLLLGFVGTLTLAIGGVGLANIMLVSVTERTREIGILKSLGATRGSILAQFLLEAMAIVTIGGVFGVLAGWSLTSVLGTLPLLGPLFKDTSGQGDIHLHLSAFSVIASTIMLEMVGLISGFLPAVKASRLDPILALHYE